MESRKRGKMNRTLSGHGLYLLHFTHNKELSEFYVSIALRFLALSMIGIFIPIFLLYEIALPLSLVLYFFIAFAFFFIFSSLLAAYISARIGFKHLILLSVPFQISFILLLALLENFRIPLFLIAAAGAIASGFYWIGHHADLAKFTKKKKRASQVGLSFFVVGVSALIGPIVGGLLLTEFSYVVLFVVTSVLLLLSTIPLFFTKDFYQRVPFSARDVFRGNKARDALAFMGQGIEIGTLGVLWPIFIFSLLGAYFALGLVGTFGALMSSVASIIIGRVADKVGRKNVLRVGAYSLSVLWFFRTLVSSASHVFLVTIFSFVTDIAGLPMDSVSYTKAHYSKSPTGYLVFREIFINIGKIIAYVFMLLAGSFIATFIFTGAAQALLLLF